MARTKNTEQSAPEIRGESPAIETGADDVIDAASDRPTDWGWDIDPETGEMVRPRIPWDFRVQTRDDAEIVLGHIADCDAAIAGAMGHPEVLRAQAIIRNAEAVAKEHRRRREFLFARFENEIRDFAKSQLTGKSKTLKLINGSISFRVKPAAIDWREPDDVVAFLREHAPQSLRGSIDLVNVAGDDAEVLRAAIIDLFDQSGQAAKLTPMRSWIPDDIVSDLMENEDLRADAGFVLIPETETMAIKSGVE